MKKYILLIVLCGWLGLESQAQLTRIRLCTEKEIPLNVRKNYHEKGKQFIENFYTNLPFCLEGSDVMESVYNNYLEKEGWGFIPDFKIWQDDDRIPVEPMDYLKKFLKQYAKYNSFELRIEVSNIFFDEDFYSNSLLNCYIIAYYELRIFADDMLLYAGRSKAQCLFPNASNWLEMCIGYISPLNDVLGNNGEYAEYVKGFLKGPKDDSTLLMDAWEHHKYKEYDKALEIWEKLAKKNNPEAIYQLGDYYERGLAVEKNEQKAFKYYSKAAKMDSDIGLYAMGRCYRWGIGVEKEDVKAYQYFKKAAERNYMLAYVELAECYHNGWGVMKNIPEAVKWYTKGAEEHDADAQFELGCLLLFGKEIQQDAGQGLQWLELASMQGHRNACFILASCYLQGQFVEQNKEQAFKLFEYAARQGDQESQFMTGFCYEFGEGTTQDYAKAKKWYKMAAELGHVGAQSNLAILLYINEEYKEALTWLLKAAEQNNAKAIFALGECYYYGSGVTQDFTKAAQYYMQAATLGDASAQYSLGYCFQHGQGVPFADLKKAKEWYTKAAEQGHSDAKSAIEKLNE